MSWGKIRAGAETVKVGCLTPRLQYTGTHQLSGLRGRDARVPVARRRDVRQGYKFGLDMTWFCRLALVAYKPKNREIWVNSEVTRR